MVNNPITLTPDATEHSPQIVSDGSGGCIIVWVISILGLTDVYAQRIDATGVRLWNSDGVPVCTASDDQGQVQITTDGSGGVIIAWRDRRSGPDGNIYAQRLDAGGVSQWTPDGVVICADSEIQLFPEIASDGSGGAIITWQDNRAVVGEDIYAQRVNASGVVQWTADGVPVCTASGRQDHPQIVSDGMSGAVVAWSDARSSVDIYAQRINSSGAALWTANGVAICTASGNQVAPQITSDGESGAIVSWMDSRGSDYDVYAQRVSVSGSTQWSENGVLLSAAPGEQQFPQMVGDGSGGAVVTWNHEFGSMERDIYAQRINSSGAVQWGLNGLAVCTEADTGSDSQVVRDQSGGFIVAWQDTRSGLADIYAQRISASGVPQWAANGMAVSTAASFQMEAQIIGDGPAGAVVTWTDVRSSSGYADIYASRIPFAVASAADWQIYE